MSEMVRKVGEAIIAARRKIQQRSGTTDIDGMAEIMGRAAIEAMREPTEAMMVAGLAQKDECENGGTSRAACVIEHAWSKMIGEALKS